MDMLPLRAITGPIDCSLQENYSVFNDTQGSETCHVCLSTGAVVGLSFHAEIGVLSLAALLMLLFIIARNYYRMLHRPDQARLPLFRCNVDVLMLNLIISDIVMSFGAILDIRWVNERQVYCGSYCNAQGVFQTIGETAAALSTLSVAVYTFVTLISPRPPAFKPKVYSAVIIIIWLWVFLWAIILLTKYDDPGVGVNGDVLRGYIPSPWWCWINGRYMAVRIVAEYLWLWFAGICTIALYVPAYFIARNRQPPHEPPINNPLDADDIDEGNEAVKLLWYPLAYTICVLPVSVIRWASWVNPELFKRPEFLPASMFAVCIFNLMGLINVALIYWTRPAILLIGAGRRE